MSNNQRLKLAISFSGMIAAVLLGIALARWPVIMDCDRRGGMLVNGVYQDQPLVPLVRTTLEIAI